MKKSKTDYSVFHYFKDKELTNTNIDGVAVNMMICYFQKPSLAESHAWVKSNKQLLNSVGIHNLIHDRNSRTLRKLVMANGLHDYLDTLYAFEQGVIESNSQFSYDGLVESDFRKWGLPYTIGFIDATQPLAGWILQNFLENSSYYKAKKVFKELSSEKK